MSLVAKQSETAEHIGAEPIPGLWQAVSSDALIVLQELRVCPVSSRQERILRTIASKYYKRGYCFAKHETIAQAVRCAKSTVQLDLDELEARGLIAVNRRPGTSNLTILAPGLVEALRTMRLERRRAQFIARRGVERVLDCMDSYKKIAATAIDELTAFTRGTVAAASAKISTVIATKPGDVKPLEAERRAQNFDFSLNRPKAVSQPRTSSPNFVSAKASCDDALKKKYVTEKLCHAGVSPRQASRLVQLFGIERVNLNLQLNLHQKASNPGGFLAMAIRENYAASHVVPGSEAAAARQREEAKYRSSTTRSQIVKQPKAKIQCEPLPKSTLELVAEAFDKLSPAERDEYERNARKAFETAPPSWLISMFQRSGFDHPAIRAAIRTKAIEFWHLFAENKPQLAPT